MNRSSKYEFYLPQNSDPISVSDFNYNFQLIDSNLPTKAQSWSAAEKTAARENIGAPAAENTPGVTYKLVQAGGSESIDADALMVFIYDQNAAIFPQLVPGRGTWLIFNALAQQLGTGVTWSDNNTFTNNTGVALSVLCIETGSGN